MAKKKIAKIVTGESLNKKRSRKLGVTGGLEDRERLPMSPKQFKDFERRSLSGTAGISKEMMRGVSGGATPRERFIGAKPLAKGFERYSPGTFVIVAKKLQKPKKADAKKKLKKVSL